MHATSVLKMSDSFGLNGPGSILPIRYCEEYDKNAISETTTGTANFDITLGSIPPVAEDLLSQLDDGQIIAWQTSL